MRKSQLVVVFAALLVGAPACSKKSPGDDLHKLSPRSINLAGLRFYLTHSELSSRLNMLRCSSTDPIVKRCRWTTTKRDREGAFRGIDEIQFTLYRDSVQSITVFYTQMLDVEFKNFSEAVYDKYGSHNVGSMPDTVAAEWSYDSLTVRFTPNRRKHWAARMYTYTPVLEFRELMLYRRWADEVEKQKVYALY